MAAITLNRQPIFTGTPKLITSVFDPLIPTDLTAGIDNSTSIYEDASSYGTLITKITVSATALIGDTVTTKVIYLGIQDLDSNVVALYQSKIMTGITGITATDIVPYVTFEFNGGLITNSLNGFKIHIAASTNSSTTGESGDYVSVVVEGGTYDDPAI